MRAPVRLAVLSLFMLLAPGAAPAGVSTTKHNLSVSGPGTLKASGETQVCLFCHAPHNTSPSGQLWNRHVNAGTYTPYTSSTRKSLAGQPTGASLLCLSCHDGTIALGQMRSRASAVTMAGGVTAMPAVAARLGTDLSDDHPVSFVYDAALRAQSGELADPATLVKPNRVRLDAGGQMQCTSCHDPHDDTYAKFLVAGNTASALCQACHVKWHWTGSDHRNSAKTLNRGGADPWPHTSQATVAANACENCHRPHTAGGGKQLLIAELEENNCFPCHNGSVAAHNIQAEFNKASAHRVADSTRTHDPMEAASVASSHVECVDCHNPHAAAASSPPAGSVPGSSAAPALAGSQVGVRGIGIAGTEVDPALEEYEICLRCHADGAGNTPGPRTPRVLAQNNKRLQFQPTNPSFHPVAAPGRSATVPSLLSPWTTSSRMRCTDCHNNNAGPYSSGTPSAPTGSGPNGPHGSIYPPLLERPYQTAYASESAGAYALCYKCHSRTSLLSTTDGSFPAHRSHLVDRRVPCNACHDPHGISGAQGTSGRLINFDTSKVARTGTEPIRWERVGSGGRCYLVCHADNGDAVTHNATRRNY